jgi:hypothetical protein
MDGYVDKHLNTYKYVSLEEEIDFEFLYSSLKKENTFHIMTIRI